VEKLTMPPARVFDLIRSAGGAPVLAHPGVTRIDERIEGFIADGLAGIEAYHSEHSAAVTNHYVRLCAKHGLAFTGGSDFHSPMHNKCEIGVPKIPYTAVKSLREKISATVA
jgi:predicted metal-dependent phosphoesterase TrpH